jgi:hypothetical protein
MTKPSAFDLTPFRVTLFFGPERAGNREDNVRCVFNVKRRSWKGGVQVSVDISHSQLQRIRSICGFAAWSADSLKGTSAEERAMLLQRMEDAFTQSVCARKLDLALASGIDQRSQTIAAETWVHELDGIADKDGKEILSSLHAELDLPDPPPAHA